MIAGVDLLPLLALASAVLVGSTLQGAVGLGLGLVLAPIIGLVAPELLPGLALWLALVYPLLTLTRDWRHIDWRGLAWAIGARIPGTVVGVLLVTHLPARALHVVVGVVVLLAVALSVRTVRLQMSRASLAGAGFVSGITGTTSSIGGPPLALLYQRQPPDVMRSTMGVVFVLGAALSLTGLGVAGELGVTPLIVAALLVPLMVLGFLISGRVRAHLNQRSVRAVLLIVCSISAVALIVRSLV